MFSDLPFELVESLQSVSSQPSALSDEIKQNWHPRTSLHHHPPSLLLILLLLLQSLVCWTAGLVASLLPFCSLNPLTFLIVFHSLASPSLTTNYQEKMWETGKKNGILKYENIYTIQISVMLRSKGLIHTFIYLKYLSSLLLATNNYFSSDIKNTKQSFLM